MDDWFGDVTQVARWEALAKAFGPDEKTAMRYADSARALLHQAAEQPLQ
ncbi:hypothetical protein ACNPQM_23290 [Streptomyces sp. NPDC056231]